MALKNEDIHKGVSEFYAGLVKEGGGDCCAGCCTPDAGAGCCPPESNTGIAESVGYTKQDLDAIPDRGDRQFLWMRQPTGLRRGEAR